MSDEIHSLKEAEKDISTTAAADQNRVVSDSPALPRSGRRRQRHRESLFGPIVMIGIGSYFLLTNLNLIDGDLHWAALFQLWPVFLIFLGVNIVVRQIPGALGTLATALVGLIAVGLAGIVLLFSDQIPVLDRFGITGGAIEKQTIDHPLDEAQSAVVTIDAGSLPLQIDSLSDSSSFIQGEISYTGTLNDDFRSSGGEISYTLAENNRNWSGSSSFSREDRWSLSLTPRIPLDLHLDLASGSSTVDLSRLQLAGLVIDAGSGSSKIELPAGNYEIVLDMGSGASSITLPASGKTDIRAHTGSGSSRYVLPAGMPMRITLDKGSGGFFADNRFELVTGERGGDGVWETADYDSAAPDRIELDLDAGSGSVTISRDE